MVGFKQASAKKQVAMHHEFIFGRVWRIRMCSGFEFIGKLATKETRVALYKNTSF
jgi:hypothetical protein